MARLHSPTLISCIRFSLFTLIIADVSLKVTETSPSRETIAISKLTASQGKSASTNIPTATSLYSSPTVPVIVLESTTTTNNNDNNAKTNTEADEVALTTPTGVDESIKEQEEGDQNEQEDTVKNASGDSSDISARPTKTSINPITSSTVTPSLATTSTTQARPIPTTTNPPSFKTVSRVLGASKSDSKHPSNSPNSNLTPQVQSNSKNFPTISRRGSSTHLLRETSNEVLEQDLELLCHHYYPDNIIGSSSIEENGCRLKCILLVSSTGEGYLDSVEVKSHNLNQGRTCDPYSPSFRCVDGACIEPPETGKAFIVILNATVPNRDADSLSDPFVKVFLDDKYLLKTDIKENTLNPKWNTGFYTPIMSNDMQITFMVMDKDPSGDELLLTVQTSPSFVVNSGVNGTTTCLPPDPSPHKLCHMIAWLPELD